MRLHETHNWRYSDSSLYDAVCTQCNYTDASPQAEYPCGQAPIEGKLLQFAKQAGIKAQSELALSPQEQKFAELIIKECSKTLLESRYKIAETDYYDGFNEALVYSANRIEELFGIE